MKKKPIHLALQGGGAHGAFTWGVLDYLLEDNRLSIEAISGTSAGALNAAAMAGHYVNGDVDKARESLHDLWFGMSQQGIYSPYNFMGVLPMAAQWGEYMSWFYSFFDVSPYQDTFLNIHFLRRLLEKHIDFDLLNYDCSGIRLFVSTTNVLTNKLHIFSNEELSIDVLLASSCLPKVHRAVEIDGEHYWDGGFMGNPVLEPLVKDGGACDIMVVQINPLHIKDVPTTPMEISERMEMIGFNATLSREIRNVAEIQKMVEAGDAKMTPAYKKHLHLLHNEEAISRYGSHTKYDTSWHFLKKLKALGRESAKNWLDENYASIGKESTLDLDLWESSYKQPACQLPK